MDVNNDDRDPKRRKDEIKDRVNDDLNAVRNRLKEKNEKPTKEKENDRIEKQKKKKWI